MLYEIDHKIDKDVFCAVTYRSIVDPLQSIHLTQFRERTTVKGDLNRAPFCVYGDIKQAIQELNHGTTT